MSKAPTGLFSATKGDNAFYGNPEALIAMRVNGLDLREHPVQYKQLSSKLRKRIKSKISKRTATKEEYKRFTWDQRFRNRRKKGTREFWRQERIRLIQGLMMSRNWDSVQKEDILRKKTPQFKGKTMQAHHAYSVVQYPHLANRSEVMYPATPYEHFHGWHGGNYKQSKPGERIRKIREL